MPTTITDRWRASMRVLVLCAASVMSAVAAGETTVLTLEQALARASSEGSATLIAASERERAAARARQARAWENPTLSVEVENVLGRGPYRDFDAAESTVSLSQPLPLGGGRGARVTLNRLNPDHLYSFASGFNFPKVCPSLASRSTEQVASHFQSRNVNGNL